MPTEKSPASASPSAADAAVRAIIARSRPEDYDGHTEFARLTPRERLAWLDFAVVLWESRGGAVEEQSTSLPPDSDGQGAGRIG